MLLSLEAQPPPKLPGAWEGEAQGRLGLEFRYLPPIPKGQKAEGELFVTSLSVMARIIASLKIIFQGVNFLGIE